MSGGRWAEVRGARDSGPPDRPASNPTRRALQRITANEDYAVLVGYLRDREWQEGATADQGDAGALLRQAGRRSLIRELEGLAERVRDDAPAGAAT